MRDWLIGHCGKTEREAEVTGWVELRALQKGKEQERYDAWARARMIAHSVYLFAPVFGRGARKETDPRRFFPLPGDEVEREQPTVVHLSEDDIKELNRINTMIQ